MHRRRFLWFSLAGGAALLAGGAVWRAFATDMARARARISGRSAVFQSRFGTMEYATAGSGPPCIMIHGTGGGFDQGLAFAQRLVAAGRQVVAPSRFGYLRTAMPAEPTSENQADAIVDLMDELRIDRAPVIGGSAGALSALQFAIRHPDRCSALAPIVPATYVPGHIPQPPSAIARAIMDYGLKSDFLFWAGIAGAEDAMVRALLATDPALVHRASPSEQARVRAILTDILPVSARARGLANDAALTGAPAPMALDRISAPTLVISLEDDGFGTVAAARHIANSVPDAKLTIYPSGGHVWVGHDEELFAALDAFLPRGLRS